ncbi:unnamed protein product [Rangifer tarandus platyrhynchus]|uniref:Uncharacterized protein n=1 Tax=Rangifer tarandus platyrhynchus TaxID=3082113 RepID=A0ABN9A7I0_RANTA|nr:unnamed protein product [Rangifer tarandus platyrhynchus]
MMLAAGEDRFWEEEVERRRPPWPRLSSVAVPGKARLGLQLSGQPRHPCAAPSLSSPAGAPWRRAEERRPPAARRGSGAPAGKPGPEAAAPRDARTRARIGGRRAPARESGRPGAGTRRLQPSPGARGWTPRRRGAGKPPPGERASGGPGGGRAPRTPSSRPWTPLTQLGDVGLSFRPWSDRFGRRLPRPARCLLLRLPTARDHADDRIHMESKFIKIHVKPPATYLYS